MKNNALALALALAVSLGTASAAPKHSVDGVIRQVQAPKGELTVKTDSKNNPVMEVRLSKNGKVTLRAESYSAQKPKFVHVTTRQELRAGTPAQVCEYRPGMIVEFKPEKSILIWFEFDASNTYRSKKTDTIGKSKSKRFDQFLDDMENVYGSWQGNSWNSHVRIEIPREFRSNTYRSKKTDTIGKSKSKRFDQFLDDMENVYGSWQGNSWNSDVRIEIPRKLSKREKKR